MREPGRLAITNAGTIPDRGLYGVFLPDGTRVGELDEEMVYESRRGEVFVLGASSWRIEDITRDRVVVVPAPGEPGKMPFWKGDKPGRPLELGRALGAFTRELATAPRADSLARLRDDVGLDELAAENLVKYVDDQREATGAVPDDHTIVVERFRDELGDWRLCILSPFGQRVHAPWGLAIEARLAERVGPGAQVLWSDDGIVIRLPESEDRIPLDDLLFDPDEIEEEVVRVLPGTALFASAFREASARALLLPRRRPGQRTALWQQRQRSADLLVAAAKHPTFPMLLETTRECLRDVFDVPALREVMTDLRSRKTKLVAVDTERASPFAQSLLFRWVAIYMYEGDAPLAERRAAALALDRDLLRELLGEEELRDLLDPAALDELEMELQGLAEGRRARNADDVHDLLVSVGDMTEAELAARTEHDPAAWIEQVLAEGRAVRVRVAGEQRLAAVEDAAALRDALGVSLPIGLPAVFTEPTERPLELLVARYARTHAPFLATPGGRAAGRRCGPGARGAGRAGGGRSRHPRRVPARRHGGGVEREWCDVDVLRRLRRRSLAALRKEVEPVDAATLGRFLPEWQGVATPASGPDALMDAIARLQGAAVPASILEHDVLRSRVRGFRPADLDAMCASGDLVWIGAGPLGADDGRVSLYVRDQVRLLAPPPPEDPPSGELHVAIREHLRARGASFWPDLVQAAGTGDERVVLAALWDLVWAGEVTNDTMAPLRALTAKRSRATPRRGLEAATRRAPPDRTARRRRTLVARGSADGAGAEPDRGGPRASAAAARSSRRADARGGAVRGRAGRLRGRLRRAEGAGDVGQGPARVLRGRARRGAVRRAGRRRSDPGVA